MQRVICTLLWTVGRNANEGTSWYSPASRPSIAALAIFFIGLLTYSAAAQTSPQSLTTQARITHAISPQILAMHALAKRPVAAAPTSLGACDCYHRDLDHFQFRPRTWPRTDRSRPRVQPISRATFRGSNRPSLIFWPESV